MSILEITAHLNALAAIEHAEGLIPQRTVASLWQDDDDGTLTITLDLVSWREGARTHTEAGRAELARERAALGRLRDSALDLCRLVEVGVGDGEHGSFESLLLAEKEVAS
jgi:hypothetical protein